MSTSYLLTTFHTSVINKLYARSSSSSYAFILKFKLQLVNLFSWTPYNLNLFNNSLELFFFNTKLTPLLWLTQNNPYKILTSQKFKNKLNNPNLRTKLFLKKFKQIAKVPYTKMNTSYKRSNNNISRSLTLFSHNQFLNYRDKLRTNTFPLFNPLVRHRYMRNFLLVEGSYEKKPLFFKKSRRPTSPIRNPLFKFRRMKAKLEYLDKKKDRIKKAQIISYVNRNKFRESLFVSMNNKRAIRARRVLQKLKSTNLISREQKNSQRLQYLHTQLNHLLSLNVKQESSSFFKTKLRRIIIKLLSNYTQELYIKKLTDRVRKLKRQPFFKHQKKNKWARKILKKSHKSSRILRRSSLWLQIQHNTQLNSQLLLKRSQGHSYRSLGLNQLSYNSLSRKTKHYIIRILLKKQNPKNLGLFKTSRKSVVRIKNNQNKVKRHNKSEPKLILPGISKSRLTLKKLINNRLLYNNLTRNKQNDADRRKKLIFNGLRINNSKKLLKMLNLVNLGLFSRQLKSEIYKYIYKKNLLVIPKVRRRRWINHIRKLSFRRKHLRAKKSLTSIRRNLTSYLLQVNKINLQIIKNQKSINLNIKKTISPSFLQQQVSNKSVNTASSSTQTSNSIRSQSPKLFKKPNWFKQVVLNFNNSNSDSYSSLYEKHPRLLRTAFAKRVKKSSLRVKKQAIPRQHLFLNIREGRLNSGQLKPLKSRLLKMIMRRYKRRWKRLNQVKVKSYIRRIRIKKVAKKLLLVYRLRHYKGPNKPRKLVITTSQTILKKPTTILINSSNYPKMNSLKTNFTTQYNKLNNPKLYSTLTTQLNIKNNPYQIFRKNLLNGRKNTIVTSQDKTSSKLRYLMHLFYSYRTQRSDMPKFHQRSKFKWFTLRNKHRNVRRKRPLSTKKTHELETYKFNRKKELLKLSLFKKFIPKSFLPRFIFLLRSQFKNPSRRKKAYKKPVSWLSKHFVSPYKKAIVFDQSEKGWENFTCKKDHSLKEKLINWNMLLNRRLKNYAILTAEVQKNPATHLKHFNNYFRLLSYKKRSYQSLRNNKKNFRMWQLLWKDCLVNCGIHTLIQPLKVGLLEPQTNPKFNNPSTTKFSWTNIKRAYLTSIETNFSVNNLFKLVQSKNSYNRKILVSKFSWVTPSRSKELNNFTPHVINSVYFKSKGIQILEADLAINNKYGTKFILSNLGFLYNPTLIQQISKSLRANIVRQKYSFFSMSFVKRTLLKKRGFFNINKLPVIAPHLQNPGHRTSSMFSSQSATLLNFNNLLRQHVSNTNPNYKVEPWVKPYRYTHYLAENHNIPVQIRRIRFKPGYSRIWRDARSSLNQSLNLNLRYQYRLTVFLNRFARVSSSTHSQLLDLKVIHVLMRSRFAPDVETSNALLNNSLVFLNGYNTSNPNLLLFKGDVIQLIISLKYYIIYRWLINWNLFKRTRLSKLARAKFKKMHHAQTKQRSFKIPNWVLTSRVKGEDIPKFLEVDFFTLSSFVVYDPFLATDLELSDLLESRFEIYNMYNWKYVN